MEIDLQKLKELAERATRGEWQVDADARHIRIVTADDACVYPFWITPTPNKAANAAYIAAASPDVVLTLIEELERLRAREAGYRQYLAGIRQGLELREADEKENEKELEKALDEVERLKKLSELWKHDYEELAASASDARKKNERLEKEADWLAEELAESRGECPYANDPDYWDGICKHENCVDNVMACWRAAARRSVEKQCKQKP